MSQIPDGEAIVTAYLAAQTDLRIVGETPDDISVPWVRITQLDAANETGSRPEHLIAYMFQIECYAGEANQQEEAHDGIVEVREVLAEMGGVHDGAVISAVKFAGMPRVPDLMLKPARQRFILTAHVYAHQAT